MRAQFAPKIVWGGVAVTSKDREDPDAINPGSASASERQSFPLRNQGIYRVLDDDAVDELQKLSRTRFVEAGKAIFRQGDDANFLFSVMFGAVKLSTPLVDGRQHIIELLYPPSFHGLGLDSTYSYSAHAVSDVALCTYSRAAFHNFLKRHIALEHRIFEMAILELDQSRERVLMLARMDSFERVAYFLSTFIRHVLAVGCGSVSDNSAQLRLPLSRAEIADYLGLTLETVSRQLSVLRKRGIIDLNGWREVTVPDIRRLAETAATESVSPALRPSRDGNKLRWIGT